MCPRQRSVNGPSAGYRVNKATDSVPGAWARVRSLRLSDEYPVEISSCQRLFRGLHMEMSLKSSRLSAPAEYPSLSPSGTPQPSENVRK